MAFTGATAVDRAFYGEGTGLIALVDVACSGTEASIVACPSDSTADISCSHGEDSGVQCSERENTL